MAELQIVQPTKTANVVTYPGSPFKLHQPFAPAGDQPTAIEQLCEGINDGLFFQTLLGVTGSGKTYTMANVIARMGRPAIIFAPNKTLAAQLYAEFREFFPENAVEYFVSYYDYYQPEAYVPQRDLFIEKDSSINEHIEQMRLSCTKSLMERRDVVIVATVSGIYGIGNPNEYHQMILTLRQKDRVAQRDIIARLIQMQYAQRSRFRPRHLPRARRHHRHLPGRACGAGGAPRNVRRRAGIDPAVRSVDRARAPEDPALHRLSRLALRDAARHRAARYRDHQGRAARTAGVFPPGEQAHRRTAAGTAHPLRPGDDDGNRFHQGHRKLLAPSERRAAGRAAADAGRLPAGRRADVPRRVARAGRPVERHVQRRPFAQDQPGRLRFPPAVGAGQPSAEVRGIPAEDAPDRVRLGHAGRI